MRLLRLKINQKYKSIDAFDYGFRQRDDDSLSFSPICFVGVNGSGKSNIIEALSEIFCYLDLFILDYEKAPQWAKKSPLSFEVEYLLTFQTKLLHIKILSTKNRQPEFYLVDIYGNETKASPKNNLLPSRIIGYSSGHNESISYPYLKNQGFYAIEVLNAAKQKKNKLINHTHSLFMDYEINSLILITNYLFAEDTLIFEKIIRIKKPISFQININLLKVIITMELRAIINNLQSAAISSESDDKTFWKLDFLLNDSTKIAIQTLFESADNFFTSLYKLTLLNAIRLTRTERNFYTNEVKDNSLRERPPVVAKENKVFNIDKLKIQLTEPDIEIDYSGLSDGEHQFIHIFGTIMLFNNPNCLFLLDEPESHFNPQWRVKFINLISEILGVNDSEFILSTHSPYVISAAQREHVLKFYRVGELIKYMKPTRETFGATFKEILEELFDVENSISAYSKKYINKKINSKDLEKMEKAVFDLAESPDKLLLYDAIYDLAHPKK